MLNLYSCFCLLLVVFICQSTPLLCYSIIGKFNFFPLICFLFSSPHRLTLVHCFLQLSPFALKSLPSTLRSLGTVQPCVRAGKPLTPDTESVCWSSASFISNKTASSHSVSMFSIISNPLIWRIFCHSSSTSGESE